MATHIDITMTPILRLQSSWIDEERRLFNLDADFVDGRPITEPEWDARCQVTGNLFRKIATFPAKSMADVFAKARYVARLCEDEGEPLEDMTLDEVNDDTLPYLVIRDLLALGEAARA